MCLLLGAFHLSNGLSMLFAKIFTLCVGVDRMNETRSCRRSFPYQTFDFATDETMLDEVIRPAYRRCQTIQ